MAASPLHYTASDVNCREQKASIEEWFKQHVGIFSVDAFTPGNPGFRKLAVGRSLLDLTFVVDRNRIFDVGGGCAVFCNHGLAQPLE